MLTTKYVRDNIEAIRKSLERRKSGYQIDTLLKLDEEWRVMQTRLQSLQAKKNKASLEISEAKKKGASKTDLDAKIAALSEIKTGITTIETDLPKLNEKVEELLWNLPNNLHESVPVGAPPEANRTLRTWGTIRNKTGENHETILTRLGLLDIERAAKTAGSRFYYLKGDLVLLEQSLLRFALDELVKKGYTPVLPPFMLRKKYYKGVAPLGVFQDALYSASDAKEAAGVKDYEKLEDELFMISTSEHALASMHAEETLSAKDLPMKYCGISPCFRREAGSHGKDTKGIFRVHQFDKVEQFIYCRKEDDDKYFDELLANSESFLQKLGIPYNAVMLCGGDTGHRMARTVDLEGYFPSQAGYRELTSCSSAADWQSMRLDIRYDEGGERKYAYMLNSTAISAQRMLVAVVENYANPDGSITVPDVLVPYMGKDRIAKA